MWLKLLIRLIPIERIVAGALDWLLRKIEQKQTPEVEKSTKRVKEAFKAFSECVEDPRAVGRPAREAIRNWAKGQSTPDIWREIRGN